MKNLKFILPLLLTAVLTACSPPDERYTIINDGDENLEITYHPDLCIVTENAEFWKPKLRSKDDSGKEQTIDFSVEDYDVKATRDEIVGYSAGSEPAPKTACEKRTYHLRVPQNSAAIIYLGKYQGFRLNYLQLKNAKGTITYEGNPRLIEDAFTMERLTPLTGVLNGRLSVR